MATITGMFVPQRSRWSTLIILLVLLAAALPAQPARAGSHTTEEDCTAFNSVPVSECAALVALYNATDGANWLNATGWLTPTGPAGPCDWYGVICSNGHVVELRLARNRLSGSLPALNGLPELQWLDLAGNRLTAVVYASFCPPRPGLSADLSYNALAIARLDIRSCLERSAPGWAATQTTPPRDAMPVAFESTAVLFGWTPIDYTSDGGFYQISYATNLDGPYTVHGQTASKASSSYRLNGLAPGTTYHVRVQAVTSAHANNPAELRSVARQVVVVTRAPERMLLMVYFPADNDLSPHVPAIIERLRFGSQYNPNIQIVMLADQRGTNDTVLMTIAGGVVRPTNAVFAAWGRRELNTAAPAVLAWFLSYARTTYPASRELVSLMGHGLALAPEIIWPEQPDPSAAPAPAQELASPASPDAATTRAASAQSLRIPALPRGIDATPSDVTDRGYMSTIGLGRALLRATQGGSNPFDIIFFDQCFQGNLDTLYEVRAAAEIFIASPNYAWLVAPYHQYLPLLAPTMTNEQIAAAIIERYQINLNDWHPNVIFAVRRTNIEAVAQSVSQLGNALRRALRAGQAASIGAATQASQYVDTTQCGQQNLTLGPPDELVGAGSLALNLRMRFPAGDAYGVHDAADRLIEQLDLLHKRVRIGSPYLAPGEVWDYTNTLTVLAPLPVGSPASVAWRSSIYTATMPLSATWTAMPTMTVQISSSLAFVRDGGWDEFLAAWYSTSLTPTIGEWCHYIPPALTGNDEQEPLSLSASEIRPISAQLSWSATTNEEANTYWIYRKGGQGISWVAYTALPISQTAVPVDALQPGTEYRFMVVAQDAAGTALAQSNELVVRTLTPGGGAP